MISGRLRHQIEFRLVVIVVNWLIAMYVDAISAHKHYCTYRVDHQWQLLPEGENKSGHFTVMLLLWHDWRNNISCQIDVGNWEVIWSNINSHTLIYDHFLRSGVLFENSRSSCCRKWDISTHKNAHSICGDMWYIDASASSSVEWAQCDGRESKANFLETKTKWIKH